MGNCQAIDAAALVIQHPNGRLERMYWPVSAIEVMRMNPGHYVSLIIPLSISEEEEEEEEKKTNNDQKTVRFTRVKLLKPTDTLALGHAYRLLSSQEVTKVMRAKKNAKLKKNQPESGEKDASAGEAEPGKSELRNSNQVIKHERRRLRTAPMNLGSARSKTWRPSLQSISEAGS